MEIKRLLEVRTQLKKKKPEFVRRDVNKKARLERKWHRPKGIQNKMRLQKKGYCRVVATGFGSPNLVKGLTKEGLVPTIVCNVEELSKLNPKTEAVIVGSTVGQRKRLQIVEKAKELKLKVKNIKDLQKYLSEVQEEMKLRKERKEVKGKLKEEKAKEAKKKAEEKVAKDKEEAEVAEKSTSEEAITAEEELSKKEAQEKNKVLTQRK